ncbi:hypothetical protein M5689_021159 [Euphorbia peplus]|nr:hypothetical protein M5689_021159 [Euphorbia peplus]
MVQAFWSFLLRSPQGPVPSPWERCYDIVRDMLYYKNGIDGTLIVDLRSRVDIEDGLYYESGLLNVITELADLNWNNHYYYRNLLTESEMMGPFLIGVGCCGSQFYLVVPEKIFFCPNCAAFINYQDSPTA